MASHRRSNSQTNSKRPSDGDNGQASKRHKPRDDLSENFLTKTRTRTRRIPTLKQAENGLAFHLLLPVHSLLLECR